MTKLFSLSVTLVTTLVIFGCTQPETRESTSISTVELVITQREVVAALKVVPEARPYIDEHGYFDYGSARVELGAVDARLLRSKWNEAFIEAVKKA